MIFPLVSVIMPAYNSEKHIAQSIESIISQTYSNWELIIIDDGSVDNTSEIVNLYAVNDQRIKYIFQENGRQGKARNNGLKHASGDLIAFLDSDDIWVKEKLEVQIRLIEEKGVDLIFGSFYLFDDQKILGNVEINQKIHQGKEDIEMFIHNNQIGILTVLCKRKILEEVNGFSERIEIQNAEDYHLWLRLLLEGFTFYSDDRIIAGYRQHIGAITNNDKTATVQVVNALFDISFRYLEWANYIRSFIRVKLKHYLYHHKLNSKEKAMEIANQIQLLNAKPFHSKLFKLFYNLIGERLFKKFLLRNLEY